MRRGGATTYGSVPLVGPEPKESTNTVAKAVFVLAHALLIAAVFHGGRASFTGARGFDHADVLDLVDSCPRGNFVGGCQKCEVCAESSYSAGGCSYFKDTFCTLCEPIKHCPQTSIRCTTQDDMFCLSCDQGFWDVDCKPCTVCDLPNDYFETKACAQESDTVCQKATQCIDDEDTHEYVSKRLEMYSDRECTKCSFCPSGTWTEHACRLGSNEENLFGVDTHCSNCTHCAPDHLTASSCTIDSDTVCEACKVCGKEEYISELCQQGDIFNVGRGTVCTGCTIKEEEEWELFPCGGTNDALFRPCSKCLDGEYMQKACTNASDTLCPDCDPVGHCPQDKLTCTDSTDSVCERCDEGFDGDHCCYQKTFGDCGTETTRERAAFQFGFDGETNEEFVRFCMSLCEEFPDCLAFEVNDGGTGLDMSGANSLVGKDSKCFMKAAYTIAPVDPTKDCFSNICRQGLPKGLSPDVIRHQERVKTQ